MKYSTLDEDYPDSKNPFDFRPPAKLSFRTLGHLSLHIVRGLKIETEQGIEAVQSLMDRAYAVVKRMEVQSEADPEPAVQTLPECLRDDARALIRTVRMNISNLKDVKEVDSSDPDCEPPTHSW